MPSFLRDTLYATLAALAVVGLFLISERHPPSRRAWPDEGMRSRIDQKIEGEIHFNGNLLGALQMLNDHGAGVLVDWDGIHKLLVDRGSLPTFSIEMRTATVEQWLDVIEWKMREMVRLMHWTDQQGVVHLTRSSSANPPRTQEVFDVRDLVADAVALSKTFPVARWNSGRTNKSKLDPAKGAEQDLYTLIRGTTGAYTWDYIGSGNWPAWGRSVATDGRLFVEQTPEILREIEVVLDTLRSDSAYRAGER